MTTFLNKIDYWLVLISFLTFGIAASGCQSNNSSANKNQSREETNKNSNNKASGTPSPQSGKEKVILFFGNSLTAGLGVDKDQAFPSLIQDKIDSLGLNYKVVNAGISGETTAAGDSRVDWVLERQHVDIFVLELGANDGLRGIPTEETRSNLNSIISKVKTTYPEAKIILTGMQVPPNMGQDYAREFQQIFKEVATRQNITLMPFLLEGVAGEPELNQEDGIHPNVPGHEIIAKNVWEVLKEAMETPAI